MPDKESPQPPRCPTCGSNEKGFLGGKFNGSYECGDSDCPCTGSWLHECDDPWHSVAAEESPSPTLREEVNELRKLATPEIQRRFDEYLESLESPSAQPGFDEATEKRWQDAIYELCKKAVGPENDSLIDGGGTDSGDALDFTLTEIWQAIAFWQDRAESPSAPQLPDELAKFRQVTDYATCGAGTGPGDLQAYLERQWARVQALEEALQPLLSPTAWFDNEAHNCKFCGANNPGFIIHKPTCEVVRAKELLTPKPANEAPETK